MPWTVPHISLDEHEGITLEWWRNRRVLTIFVTPTGIVEWQKAWGPNMWTQMEDGESPTGDEMMSLLEWICAGQ